MNDPFLVDECLSPELATYAQGRGHHATHVIYRGLGGTSDPRLMDVLRDGGFILVTSNARDFRRLFAVENLHNGLVIILPGRAKAPAQIGLFARVLDAIEPLPDLINRMVEVTDDGTVTVSEWPAPA